VEELAPEIERPEGHVPAAPAPLPRHVVLEICQMLEAERPLARSFDPLVSRLLVHPPPFVPADCTVLHTCNPWAKIFLKWKPQEYTASHVLSCSPVPCGILCRCVYVTSLCCVPRP